ncbi:uncharacterized protein LOC111084447 [Limulus polyphemus]|uniref:Uncharacterized protein LOC111084447 n=1 Tax=Limulus polyphemus TaxID=6850 RepID=A0ABM1RZQ9_LIMPO|nr:uncharacterized protein LOC111084447 [Limulus polyphemus]
MYHVCLLDIGGQLKPTSFVCPNGTIFSQASRVCGPADQVHCNLATNYYESLHGDFYRKRDDYGDLSDHIQFMKTFPQSSKVSRLSNRGGINDFGGDSQIPEEQRESFVIERPPRVRPLRRRKLRRRPGQARRRNQSGPRRFSQADTVQVIGSRRRTIPPSTSVNELDSIPENHSETSFAHAIRTSTSKPPDSTVGTNPNTTITEETQPLVNPFGYQSPNKPEPLHTLQKNDKEQPELLKDISQPGNTHLYRDSPNIQKITLPDSSRTPEIPVEATTESQPLTQFNVQLKKENSGLQKIDSYSKSPLSLDHSIVEATGQQTLNPELKLNLEETNSNSPINYHQTSVNPFLYQSISRPKLLPEEDADLNKGFNKDINTKDSQSLINSFNDDDAKSPFLSVDKVQKQNNSSVVETLPRPIILDATGKTERPSSPRWIAGQGDTLDSYSQDNSSPIRSDHSRDQSKSEHESSIPSSQEPRRKRFRVQQYERGTAPPPLLADGPEMLSHKPVEQQDIRRLPNKDRRRGLRRRQGRRGRPLRRRKGFRRRQQLSTPEGTQQISVGDSIPKSGSEIFRLTEEQVNNFTPPVGSRTNLQNSRSLYNLHDSSLKKPVDDAQGSAIPAAASSSQFSRLSFSQRQNAALQKVHQKDQVGNERTQSFQNTFVGETNLNPKLPSDPFADRYQNPHRQSSTKTNVELVSNDNLEKNSTTILGKKHDQSDELQSYSQDSYSGEPKTSSFQSSEHNRTNNETPPKQKTTPTTNLEYKYVEDNQFDGKLPLFAYQSPDRNVDVVPNKEDKSVEDSQFDEEASLLPYQSPDRNVDVVPNKEDKSVDDSRFDEEASSIINTFIFFIGDHINISIR